MPVVLRTERLTRLIGERKLVDGVSVEIRAGEVLAVVGPSGSGKSSFLRLLNRLDEPSSGTVFLQGTDYRQLPPSELRRRVGMVTQRAVLFPGSVYDNLGFGPRQRGEQLAPELARKLLDRVGLPGYLEHDVAHLSGGEAQRVSIARALANEPTVLLLDEPTSALDEASKSGVESLLKEIIAERELTCVMVTHDVAQAERMATSVLVLEQGRVQRHGTVGEVLHA
ncbi:choline transporter [Geomonas limicola]|uniref:Choline transporter n=1 Tax=Geomonas limicola TaxID=2740186 RepID=A0A6V8N2P4_9BACT|nr:phosphate ABC transporter ATP-binding protein [Geomonas limicola]GFO66808.1 choline transporter [Geomonas limicola]